jgi:regulator of RNase E activity RraA
VSRNETAEQEVKGHFVDSLSTGRIAVIEAPADAPNAVWGGLLTCRAKFLGVKGAIISGQCRDLLELHELNFPVFSKGTSVFGAGILSHLPDCSVSNINSFTCF